MTDADLIAKKLAFVETCVRELETLARPELVLTDLRERRFVEHTLQIASSSTSWLQRAGWSGISASDCAGWSASATSSSTDIPRWIRRSCVTSSSTTSAISSRSLRRREPASMRARLGSLVHMQEYCWFGLGPHCAGLQQTVLSSHGSPTAAHG